MNLRCREQHIVSIAKMDLGVGFNETTPTTIEGVTTVEVTYTAKRIRSDYSNRLDALVHDTGFVNPEQIIVARSSGKLSWLLEFRSRNDSRNSSPIG